MTPYTRKYYLDTIKNLKDEVQFLKEKIKEREQQYADLEQAIEQGEITYL